MLKKLNICHGKIKQSLFQNKMFLVPVESDKQVFLLSRLCLPLYKQDKAVTAKNYMKIWHSLTTFFIIIYFHKTLTGNLRR